MKFDFPARESYDRNSCGKLLSLFSIIFQRSQFMRTVLKRSIYRWRWLAVLPLACCVSCNGNGVEFHSVQGKVIYKDQPLKGVFVTFHPEVDEIDSIRPTGFTREDGTFSLTSGDEPGAPAGKYVVTFVCMEDVPPPKGKGMSMNMGGESADRFKGAYEKKLESKVRIEVKPGKNELEPFQLK